MLADLGNLTLHTGACPPSDPFGHARPVEPGLDKLEGGLISRVIEVV